VRRTARPGTPVARTLTAALTAGALLLAPALPVAADSSPPPAPAPAVLAPLDTAGAPAATPEGVQDAIGRLVRRDLGDASVVVLDPTTDTVLLDRAGDRPRIPASTAKLATAAAALSVLGAQARIPTVAAREGETLYLVGGGDPSLVRGRGGNPLAGGSASLRELARATADALTTDSAVQLVYDDSAFRGPGLGPAWPSSFPAAGVAAPVTALVVDGGRVRPGALSRVSDPARQAATVFASLLRDRGVVVSEVRKGRAPESVTEVARVESPPVVDLVQRMLTESENNYAEALAHLVGGKALDKPTFAGGARATEEALAGLGIDVDGLDLADGSGLSVRNRAPARVLADLLAEAVQGDQPVLAPIPPGLAVAGLTGTLADRFSTAATRPGRGFVHAKTGTLTGVSSLAGTVQDRDGRVLVFAMIANNVASLAGTRETMDVIASRLATCGCR
jgi:D-alanyl-D-alanine carboxypeptidase/D-alanyl-D-alanine-endopeptidase (penicillin-binding protein 4)